MENYCLVVVTMITHFICDNHHIISCHYTSSQANFSFCHLAFVLLNDFMDLHHILTLNKGLYFNTSPLLCEMPHNGTGYCVVMTDNNTKSGNIASHSEFQDGHQVLT